MWILATDGVDTVDVKVLLACRVSSSRLADAPAQQATSNRWGDVRLRVERVRLRRHHGLGRHRVAFATRTPHRGTVTVRKGVAAAGFPTPGESLRCSWDTRDVLAVDGAERTDTIGEPRGC